MTYRADLDALVARHAALELEVSQKQRELAQTAALLAEARQVDQAACHFDRAPSIQRRQQRHLIVGALAVALGGGAVLGYATESSAEPAMRPEARAAELTQRVSAAVQRADRRLAEYDALREMGLVAKAEVLAQRRAKRAGVPIANGAYLVREELSLAAEHQR